MLDENSLVKKIKTLLKNSKIKKIVNSKIQEFKELGKSSNEAIFNELCFCILTANYNAEKAIKIQQEIGNGFFSDKDIITKLRSLGYRYPNLRGKYIIEARKIIDKLNDIINSLKGQELRNWFVQNIKGLGYKEASHFLRNIGFTDFAIIDFHIIDILVKNKLIEKPTSKSLSKRKYLEIESVLKNLADQLGITLAELDLYLWYLETNKILK
ncbi:MAG: N-glycosylase/DNA lyase [Candidatus Helarchaeota archaeon]